MTTSVTDVTATVKCPSGTVHIGQNIQFSGLFSISASNNGKSTGKVKVIISITDSDNNSKQDTEYFDISPGKKDTKEYKTYLTAEYESRGQKKVTAQIKVEADDRKSASNNCSFTVS